MATLTNNNYVNFGIWRKNRRSWTLVKYNGDRNTGKIYIGSLCLPKEFIGKKVRLKLEVIEGENGIKN